jgi:hypothetical protein
MKCIYCNERPAEVPDRRKMGRPIKRVCRECLLMSDMQGIMSALKKAIDVNSPPLSHPHRDIEG